MDKITKKIFSIVAAIVTATVLVAGCAKVSVDPQPTETIPEDNTDIEITNPEKEKDPLTAYELLNDPLTKGGVGEASNVCYSPKDSVWDRLLKSKIPLKVGETYVETFDRDYFDTRLRASLMGNGVEAFLSSKDSYRAGDGNSLVIDSEIGQYTGVYLKGMRFAANGVYQVEFDYRILEASDDFFFQFRADSDGKNGQRTGDKFQTIRGEKGYKGSERFVVQLDNYQDYGLMVFPRNKAGKIALDNIKITRLEAGYNKLEIGQTITENFDDIMYLKLDKDRVPNSGYVTGEKAINGKSLYIESDKEYECAYLTGLNFVPGGKYRIKFNYIVQDPTSNFYVQMISKSGEFTQFYSFADSTVPAGELRTFDHLFDVGGNEAEYLLQIFPGAGNEKSAITIDDIEVTRLDTTWPCFVSKTPTRDTAVTENFEKELYHGNLLPTQQGTGTFAIVDGFAGKGLEITMPDAFSGIQIATGIQFVSGKRYDVTFDYEVLENPKDSAFYAQIGGADYKEINAITKGSKGTVHAVLTAKSANGNPEVLQIFSNQPGLKMIIDNIAISEAPDPLGDVELAIGQKYVNDFDGNNRLVFDWAAAPESFIGNTKDTLNDNSFVLNSDGKFKGTYITGIKLDPKGVYRISFDYKVLKRQDIFYFQFISKSGKYTKVAQFGDANVPLNSVRTFNQIFMLDGNEEMLMQLFPGGGDGKSSLVVDNFTVERLDGNSPVFTQKEITEEKPVSENFEKGLYGGAITPSQLGTGTFKLMNSFSGQGLEVTMPDAYAGVQFGMGAKYVSGERYEVTFDYEVWENPNNSAFYVQIGGADFKEINGITKGSKGSVKATLTAKSANGNPEILQMFSNQPGLRLVVDNIVISKAGAPLGDVELAVGESYTHDFDENDRLVFDLANVPKSVIETNDNTLDNNSLVLNTPAC